MRYIPLLFLPFLLVFLKPIGASRDPIAQAVDRLAKEIRDNSHAYADLGELTAIGSRLSGSAQAARAVEWVEQKMRAYGFDRVRLQKTKVPAWTRGGRESATLKTGGTTTELKVTALGNSIGTGPGGITAEVVEVKSLDEVDALGEAVRGKIVFYNRPMDPTLSNTFEAYGGAVDQRSEGASRAAKHGAVAAVVRSMTTLTDDHPHTGGMWYQKSIPKIPAAALSTRAANLLSASLARDSRAMLSLVLSCAEHPMVESYNVLGEVRGSRFPNEIVVVGGHLDSWDLGIGAQDDGVGVVASIETLRALLASGIRPQRTIRAVAFMAEEFGGVGAQDYLAEAKTSGEKHVAAIESDRGAFPTVGFEGEMSPEAFATVKSWLPYLAQVHAAKIVQGSGGTDVSPLTEVGAAVFDFNPESTHYFDYHHSSLDQLTVVKDEDLRSNTAAIAAFAYLLAEKGL